MEPTGMSTEFSGREERSETEGHPIGERWRIEDIPIEKIKTNDLWIRSDWDRDLDTLAKSIDDDGLLQFPAVRDMGEGYYELIFGHRRYLACKRSGRKPTFSKPSHKPSNLLIVLRLASM